MIEEREKLARRLRRRHRTCDAKRLITLAYHRDPGVAVLSFDVVRGAVCRAVVDNDDFKVLERLSEHALKRFVDVAHRVVRADRDADGRCSHSGRDTGFAACWMSRPILSQQRS